MKKEDYILLVFVFLSFGVKAQYEEGKIKTDSSSIETRIYPSLNSIRIFNELNDKNLTYYQNIYLDTKQLKTKGIFKDDDCIGIWNYYSETGELLESRDYEKGVWKVINEEKYPNYKKQEEIIEKAKQILINNYGENFYNNHLILNLNYSYKYNYSESDNWCEKFEGTATRYLLRYDIKLNTEDYFKRMIEFSLNEDGVIVFPFNLQSDIKGFQKTDSPTKIFLSEKKAINKLIDLNVLNNYETPEISTILWKYDEDKSVKIHNGNFEYSILYKSDYIEEEIGNRKRRTTKFISYNFNFWTGEYINSTKMKAIYEYGENSGFSTGLIPDK